MCFSFGTSATPALKAIEEDEYKTRLWNRLTSHGGNVAGILLAAGLACLVRFAYVNL